jgi:hypothetical protein
LSLALVDGQRLLVKWSFANTGAATLNVDGTGAVALTKHGVAALASGDLTSGDYAFVVYDSAGPRWRIVGALSTSVQPLDATLTALAALSYTSGTLFLTLTAADTFTLTTTLLSGAGSAAAPSVAIGATNKGFYDKAINEIGITISGTQVWFFNSGGSLVCTSAAGLYVGNGTVGAPLLSFRDDADCGIYRIGANNWALATAGAQSLEFAAGSVKMGSGIALQDSGGAPYLLSGKTGIPVPAGAMTPRTTNGAAAATVESTTNKIMTALLDFDASADEFAQFIVPRMPKAWNESTVTARFIWTATNTGNVVWGIQAVAISDDDPLDAAFGAAVTVTDAVTAAGDVMHSAETTAITIGGSPAEGDMVVVQVYRDADNGSDTCAVDARLIGIELYIVTNAANDA